MLVLSMTVMSSYADNIPLVKKGEPNDYDDRGRSSIAGLNASFEDECISVCYYQNTNHKVQVVTLDGDIIIDELVSYGQTSFIDVSELSPGEYILNVYAFGCWWTGTFYIE